jgi:hypothetical protein
MKYLSAMKHGVGEPGISVMAADKKIKGLAVQPFRPLRLESSSKQKGRSE